MNRLVVNGPVRCAVWVELRRQVLSSEVRVQSFYLFSDGSEGSGDGVSSPCAQTDHLPRHSVQLLVRQAPLLTCKQQKEIIRNNVSIVTFHITIEGENGEKLQFTDGTQTPHAQLVKKWMFCREDSFTDTFTKCVWDCHRLSNFHKDCFTQCSLKWHQTRRWTYWCLQQDACIFCWESGKTGWQGLRMKLWTKARRSNRIF